MTISDMDHVVRAGRVIVKGTKQRRPSRLTLKKLSSCLLCCSWGSLLLESELGMVML